MSGGVGADRKRGRRATAPGRYPIVHTADIGTQEIRRVRWLVTSGGIREGKTVAWCRMPCRKSDWPIVSMKSPKATR